MAEQVMPETDGRATMHLWLAHPPDTLVRQALDRARRAEDVAHVAVMPDVHLATDVCVGTAMATRRLLYPAAVGGDIGCGMLAIAFDADADLLHDPSRAGRMLRLLGERVPARRRNRSTTLPLPPECAETDLSHPSLQAACRDEGRLQLGTLGGGNHFVELQADANERLWLMIHSGSRAMGQAVRSHHVSRATDRSATMPYLDADDAAGQAYLHDQEWCRRFARANRRAMADELGRLLKELASVEPMAESLIECDHNHVRRERHFDQPLFVHRKGAMPADDGQAGIIPGSMGTQSVHVVGLGVPEALRSSAHGAGRQMSRQAARDRFGRTDLRHQMQSVWYDPRATKSLCEEAPRAYKDLRAVLHAQADLVKVVRTLRPLLVYKGT